MKIRAYDSWLVGFVLVSGCGPLRGQGWGDVVQIASDGAVTDANAVDGALDASDANPVTYDVQPSLDMTIVYAHSDATLYAIDPRTNAFSTVGSFGFPSDGHLHTMTDLAVDANGNIVGTTHDALYQIDAHTAVCTLLTSLPGNHLFVGLTYLPIGVLDPSSEVLVGGATDGTYWRIDPSSGTSTQLGTFQGGWGLSGDIVSIAGAGTFATVRRINAPSNSTDSLARLDPATGALTLVGDTTYSRIYGLGYWRATLFGFTRTGQFIMIDPTNGHAHMVSMPVPQFSGAGVTTLAPITPG